jgi:hypothetical protein
VKSYYLSNYSDIYKTDHANLMKTYGVIWIPFILHPNSDHIGLGLPVRILVGFYVTHSSISWNTMCNLQCEDLSFHISDSNVCYACLMHSSPASLAFHTVSTLALNKVSLCVSRPSFANKECEQVLPNSQFLCFAASAVAELSPRIYVRETMAEAVRYYCLTVEAWVWFQASLWNL